MSTRSLTESFDPHRPSNAAVSEVELRGDVLEVDEGTNTEEPRTNPDEDPRFLLTKDPVNRYSILEI